jgi:Zn-dependent protease with chaperone function
LRRIRIPLALFALLAITTAVSVGQSPDPDQEEAAETTNTAPAPIEEQVLDPSPARGPVPVPEPSEKAMRYYRSGNVLWWVNLLWSLLIPALFLWTGLSARIRDWGNKIGRRWFFALAAYLVIFSLINYVLDFPLSYYQGFVRQHAYELSNQTFSKWFGDSLKGLMVGIIIAVLFVWFPYLLLRRSRRRWWLYTGIAVVPFLFFINMIAPIWIAPLFNEFGPMKDKELEARILSLAERAGIEDSRVFEVDKSVDTEAVNAYVSGFLDTKRIVLWDTIIAKLETDELLYAMGHEMGHYVLRHIVILTFFISGVILLGLYLIYRVSGNLIRRFEHRFGFGELADFASIPLLILLFNLFFFLLAPLVLSVSRHYEHEADRFGLELTRDNYSAAMAFVKLQQENLGNPRPGPFYRIWRAGHPVLGDRIDFCNSYKPWKSGEPMRYADRFTSGM